MGEREVNQCSGLPELIIKKGSRGILCDYAHDVIEIALCYILSMYSHGLVMFKSEGQLKMY